MISLRKSANELDRLEQLLSVTGECHRLSVQSTGQYAVEVNPHDLRDFRTHMEGIEEQLRVAGGADEIRAAQARFRGELREYRDRAHEHLARLRQELDASAAAMATFASGVSTNSVAHEQKLRDQVSQLDRLAQSDDIETIRRGIHQASQEITASLEDIRRSNQMVIAQLQDEIRLLHREAEAERRALYIDPASSAWNRQKIDQRLDELLRQGDAFCLLFLVIRNMKAIFRRHSRTVQEGTLKALIRRLFAALGNDALIARWSEYEFVALLDVSPAEAVTLSRQVASKLSGNYSVQENGFPHDIGVHVTTGVVDHAKGEDAESFHKRIAQLASALKA